MYRYLSDKIKKIVSLADKVTVLLGPRQVGKTTLLKNSFPEAIYINLEKSNYIEVFDSRDIKKIKEIISLEDKNKSNILILDEVQRVRDPGLSAKIIHDEINNLKLIISGSSALEIVNKAGESLAGRKTVLEMFPLTFKEKMIQMSVNEDFRSQILESMRYGMYPALLNSVNKEEQLLELTESTVLKDVYYLNLVKNTKNLQSLLKLLAYQIGQQVNITDLANRVGVSRSTIFDYLEILKKTYVVYTLPPFMKKRRDEVSKTEKIYFWDLGIRNAVINDFSPVEYRKDYGNMFENFVITELIKLNKYQETRYNFNYWRTKWGSEVDFIMSKDQEIIGLEIKTRQGKVTPALKNTYPEAKTNVVTVENIADWVL